ncbi:MAG: SRPBCC family protein [Woeseiaceae bacterium]
MKHKAEIIIDADLDTVWSMFDDPDNMMAWQPTLKSFTHQSGTPGQPDAVSELIYNENGREVIMTETITARREPDFLGGTYESKWANVVIVNHFAKTGDGKTSWTMNAKYGFKGIMKIMALFMRKSICARSDTDMNRFKLLVETAVAGKTE